MEASKRISTAGMPVAQWRELRRAGIGGSDAAAIAGLSPYTTPFQVYADKKGLLGDLEDNEAMRIGRDLEEYVAARFTEATGKRVRKCNYILQSNAHSFLSANVDRMVIGEKAGLECKTTSQWNRADFDQGDVPPTYYVQCQHYMAVTGYNKWYLAVLVLGGGFYWYEIARNQQDIDSLIAMEKNFWIRYIVGDEIPPINGTSSCTDTLTKMYPIGSGGSISLEGMEDVAKRITTLLCEQKQLNTEIQGLKNQIKAAMGTAEYGVMPGFSVLWKNSTRKFLNIGRLKAERPELYEEYLEMSTSRRFSLKEES